MVAVENRQIARVEVDFLLTAQTYSGLWPVRAMNLSMNGVRIISPHNIPTNIPIVLHFPLKNQQAFAVAKIVNQQGNIYGCQFVGLSHKVYEMLDKALFSYIFKRPTKAMRSLWETI